MLTIDRCKQSFTFILFHPPILFLHTLHTFCTRTPLPGEKICRMVAPTLNQNTTFTSLPFKLLLLAKEIPKLNPHYVTDCIVSFFSFQAILFNPVFIASRHLLASFTNTEQTTSQKLSKLFLPIKAAKGIPWRTFSRCGLTIRTV